MSADTAATAWPSPFEYSIGHRFAAVALERPSHPAIIDSASVISYGQLLAAAIAFARRFQKLGVNRDAIVALNTGDAVASLTVLMATSLLGCRFVAASKILHKARAVEPTHFFRTREAKGKKGPGFVLIDDEWFEALSDTEPKDLDLMPGYRSPDDDWLILHTSGSTGRPKFFALSHKMVTNRTIAIKDDFPVARVTCAMLFNCSSRPFLARGVGALLNACTLIDSDDPEFWRQQGVNTVFCSPAQFATFAETQKLSQRFKRVEISGAKLDDDTARQLAVHFDQIVDIYGASETNKTFANLIRVADDGRVLRRGKRLDSDVQIIDDNGDSCAAGKIGTVRVRNNYMISGYFGSPEANNTNFSDGWFYPGDQARWGPNGELDVLGRVDDVISFGGIKLDLRLIDEILRSVSGVRDAIAFKSPKKSRNEVLGFVSFEPGIDQRLCVAQIRKAYSQHTGLPCFLGPIHEINEIPYSDEGIPQREVCEQIVRRRLGQI